MFHQQFTASALVTILIRNSSPADACSSALSFNTSGASKAQQKDDPMSYAFGYSECQRTDICFKRVPRGLFQRQQIHISRALKQSLWLGSVQLRSGTKLKHCWQPTHGIHCWQLLLARQTRNLLSKTTNHIGLIILIQIARGLQHPSLSYHMADVSFYDDARGLPWKKE